MWFKRVFQIDENRWGFEILDSGFVRLKQTSLINGKGNIQTQEIANLLSDLLLNKAKLGCNIVIYQWEQDKVLSEPLEVDVEKMAMRAKEFEDRMKEKAFSKFKFPLGG